MIRVIRVIRVIRGSRLAVAVEDALRTARCSPAARFGRVRETHPCHGASLGRFSRPGTALLGENVTDC
ncbi:hypothetical protein I546_1687 [Mycobacterium kansasii 732]|nr:hypothetical protein I546_1687 [Mycobacterium kansasii 732]